MSSPSAAPADRSWCPPPSALLSLRAVRVGIRLLGRFQVDLDDRPVPVGSWNRRSAASLVKLLALSDRRRLHREQVVDALWPDSTLESALPRLHKAAHFVRKATGVQDSVVLADDLVELFPDDDVVVDVADFERLAAAAVGSGEPTPSRWRSPLRRRAAARRPLRALGVRPPTAAPVAAPRPAAAGRALARPDRRRPDRRGRPRRGDARLLEAGDRSGVRHRFECSSGCWTTSSGRARCRGGRAAPAGRRDAADAAPAADAGPPTPVLPPALELLADDATFVGRRPSARCCASTGRWPVRGHTLLAFVTGEPGIGKSRLVSELAARCTPTAATCCSAPATRTSTSPTARSPRRSSTTPPSLDDAEVAPPRRRRRRRPHPPGARAGRPAPGVGGPRRRGAADVARRGERARRHPPLARGERGGGTAAARRRGPPLVDVHDPRRAAPPRAPSRPRPAADRRHDPRLQARPRRRPGGAARRPRAVAVGAPARAARSRPRRGRPARRATGRHEADGDPRRDPRQPAARHPPHVRRPQRRSLPIWLLPARPAPRRRGPGGARPGRDVRDRVRRRPAGRRPSARRCSPCSSCWRRPRRPASSCPDRAGAPASRSCTRLFRSARYRALPLRRRLELHARAAARAGDPARRRAAARRSGPATPAWRSRSSTPREAVDAGRAARPATTSAPTPTTKRSRTTGGRSTRPGSIDPPEPAADPRPRRSASAPPCTTAATRRGCPCCSTPPAGPSELGDTAALVRAAMAIPQFGAVGFVDPMPEGRAVTEAALDAVGDEPSADRARLLMDLASHWLFVERRRGARAGPPRRGGRPRPRRSRGARRRAARRPPPRSAIPAASTTGSASAPSSSCSAAGSTGWRSSSPGWPTQAAAHLERGQLAAWVAGVRPVPRAARRPQPRLLPAPGA